jgi:hypothetical protein
MIPSVTCRRYYYVARLIHIIRLDIEETSLMEWSICYLTMLLILPTTENCKDAGQRHIVLS